MTDHWTRESILEALEGLDDHLDRSLTAYLRGGGAMVLREFRDGTPDIDLIVSSPDELDRLAEAITSAGYEQIIRTEKAGAGTMCRFGDDREREIDLFDRRVPEGLVLSEGIKHRSEHLLKLDRLTVEMLSPEDIYLRKVIHQGRMRDKPDVDALANTELDMTTISEELATQRELVDEDLPTMLFLGGRGRGSDRR